MEFIPAEIEAYALGQSSPAGRLLDEIEAYTKAEVPMPRMLSGHLQGRTLALISKLLQPRRVLEIGTYTGYSALCLAEGLHSEGRLFTLDMNAELAPRVRQFFAASPWKEQITYTIGDARQLIPKMEGPWDLVFIDADKESYPLYYDLVTQSLRPGAVLVADNVLWSGKVLDLAEHSDKDTRALHTFNQKVQADPRVENVLLPLRDGLMVVRKK